MTEKIVLGSGKLYMAVWGEAIPADATLELDANLLGLIKGGAKLNYTPTFYEAKDDLGLVSKKILTEEVASLTAGIMTWSGKTLDKLVSTGTLDETVTGKRTLKIGGIANFTNTKYVIRFVHEDDIDGDIRVTIVGSNNTGFEIAFAKEGETILNPEFIAVPNDANGTLIIYEEEIPLTDAQKIAADKVLIEAGTYVIPTANQTDQTAKTAWVQGAVDALIVNGTVATVTFSVDTYSVALKSNEATGAATITVTEAV